MGMGVGSLRGTGVVGRAATKSAMLGSFPDFFCHPIKALSTLATSAKSYAMQSTV